MKLIKENISYDLQLSREEILTLITSLQDAASRSAEARVYTTQDLNASKLETIFRDILETL